MQTTTRDSNCFKKFSLGRAEFLWIIMIVVLFSSCQKTVNDEVIQEEPSTRSANESAVESSNQQIGINVLLNRTVNDVILKDLAQYGTVTEVIRQINALSMITAKSNLEIISKLSFIKSANANADRQGSPVDAVSVSEFSAGINTWNLDAVNVTNFGAGRTISQDGSGIYIGVLDSGLPDSWKQYFPEERIATQYAKSFGGGAGPINNVSEQPNKWEHDQNSHGVHVTSTIIGYQFGSSYVNGVAPKATIIPVKVLNQTGFGTSFAISQGVVYIADLKAGPLAAFPVVINMSIGGSRLDAVEKASIDYAVSKGVIIVAAAGNEGSAGMTYPGAYAPVISVAAAGWKDQWTAANWWRTLDVNDPTKTSDFFIASFSSRANAGQDLDVAAPGEYVVGPYQFNSGKISYYYLSGTSMASPHVAGIVALMAQKNPSLTAAQAESILENNALNWGAGSLKVIDPNTGSLITESWGADATGKGFITADAALK